MKDDHTLKPPVYRLGGIKLSEELAYFNCRYDHRHNTAFSRVLETLSAQQINIHYLSHSCDAEFSLTGFCTSSQLRDETHRLLSPLESGGALIEVQDHTGTLTLFPHKNSLRLLYDVLSLFQDHQLKIHGFCTSISALTMVLNAIDLDRSVTILRSLVDLPPNHAPLRQEFTVKQVCY